MNYLQLVNDFLTETGMEDPLSTVTDQIDDGLKAATWIRDAWVEIQRSRDDWTFRWAEGSFDTVADQQLYTQTEQVMVPGDALDCTSLRIVADGVRLSQVRPRQFEFDTTTGRPKYFAIRPDSGMNLHPIPDAVYSIKYDYWAAPVFLTLDDDTPSVSPEYHKAIVWKAIANYAREQGKEWNGLYQAAHADYKQIYSDMLIKYLPPYLGKVPLQR